MACTNPNLQNVPRDPRYRACFRPTADRTSSDGVVLPKERR